MSGNKHSKYQYRIL